MALENEAFFANSHGLIIQAQTFVSSAGVSTLIEYDPHGDVFTVNGTQMSGEVLRHFGQHVPNDDSVFQIERRDGVAIIRQCFDAKVLEEFKRTFGEFN